METNMTEEQRLLLAQTQIPYLITLLSGATILIFLDIWLRLRKVKDPSLIWLYVSLLSWAIPIAAGVFGLNWPKNIFGIPPERYKYIFSIVSSVLFAWTTFKLSRVRDQDDIQQLRIPIVITVFIISVVAWFLQFSPQYYEYGMRIDALASSIAVFALGAGFAYSFYKYGNLLLTWLAGLTFAIFIVRQVILALNGTPTSGPYAPIFLWNSTMLVMLFIALAVAWALSDVSRLKTIGISNSENIVAMFFDLRGSTQWANEVAKIDLNYVRTFIDELREWTWSKTSEAPASRPNVVKFLGDGFMYVWKVPNNSIADSSNAIVRLAYDLNTEYPLWIKEKKLKRKLNLKTPVGIGFSVDVGPARRITFENGSDDYLGKPLNIAAKMQDLARPCGGVVIQATMYDLLDDDLRSRFPKEGVMKLGDQDIHLRMTGEIELEC
jgi:class 3 adenylate cyclase